MKDFLSVCETAARTGGQVLQEWIGKFSVREKAPSDLVTEADVASQDAIRDVILGAFPDHGFISEEEPKDRSTQPDYCWIVDPLDGTTNYVHQMHHYCVSVALEHRGELLVGCVYDPNSGECYTAAKGRGAFLNGQPLRASDTRSLGTALVAVSFPPRVTADSVYVREFTQIVQVCQSVRRLGSAALNLCYVAAGRLDAFWARDIKSWDVAAGILLVQEAGGTVSGIGGGPFSIAEPPFISAGSRPLHAELLQLINRS